MGESLLIKMPLMFACCSEAANLRLPSLQGSGALSYGSFPQ